MDSGDRQPNRRPNQGNQPFPASLNLTMNSRTTGTQHRDGGGVHVDSQVASSNNNNGNQLLSMALSGDLAKAIHLANLGLQGGNGPGMQSNSNSNGVYHQRLHQMGLQRLQGIQNTQNTNKQSPIPSRSQQSSSQLQPATLRQQALEEQKTSGVVSVPCRARGMSPLEHNFEVNPLLFVLVTR